MIYDIIVTTIAGVQANADVGDRLMNLEIGSLGLRSRKTTSGLKSTNIIIIFMCNDVYMAYPKYSNKLSLYFLIALIHTEEYCLK